MNSDRVTDSHVKLNILDDTQECLNNSHHKISFDHDEYKAKIKILKQELSVTICTVNTIGTFKSQKLPKNWYFAKSKTFSTQALMSL